jgi:hypothetical protein
MQSEDQKLSSKKRLWFKRLTPKLAALLVLTLVLIEYSAQKITVETTPNGTGVIQPRGFFPKGNFVEFLRVDYTQ